MTGKVVCGIAISLDGFIAGPDDGVGTTQGHKGELLHEWVFSSRVLGRHHAYLRSVRGSPKCRNRPMSTNHVIAETASPSSVSTRRPYGRAMAARGSGR